MASCAKRRTRAESTLALRPFWHRSGPYSCDVQTIYAWGALSVVLLHLAFVGFVVGGAALLWRWPRIAWVHVPAALWGAWVELAGRTCPLTPLENRLRALAGREPYASGFVEHWLLPIVYPQGLTRDVQLALGLAVVVLNGALYGAWIVRRRRP